jgi:hypothetical protein
MAGRWMRAHRMEAQRNVALFHLQAPKAVVASAAGRVLQGKRVSPRISISAMSQISEATV